MKINELHRVMDRERRKETIDSRDKYLLEGRELWQLAHMKDAKSAVDKIKNTKPKNNEKRT